MRPKILLLQQIHDDGVNMLREFADVELMTSSTERDSLRQLQEADGIITRLAKVTASMIDAAPKLSVIGKNGVGYDNVDVAYATKRRIPVVFAPEPIGLAVAEFTIGMILALNRKLIAADAAARSGQWSKREQELVGIELRGKTVGIVGLGRIGKQVARLLHGFQVTLLYSDVISDSALEQELGMRRVSLDELLRVSDVVTLHTPLMEATQGLIGRREIGLMKKSSILVNTSRGAVVDEDALIEALRDGKIGGAALDAYKKEPLDKNNVLVSFPNVFLSPHMSGHSIEALRMTAIDVARAVRAVLSGERPRYIANPDVLNS